MLMFVIIKLDIQYIQYIQDDQNFVLRNVCENTENSRLR